MANAKMKTHKGLKKRIRITAKGHVRYKPAGSSHLMSGKGGKRKRNLRKPRILEGIVRLQVVSAVGGRW